MGARMCLNVCTGVVGAHLEIAERVALHLLPAQHADLRVHRVARALRRGHEIDLVALDDPAGDEARVVGLERLRRERLDAAQQLRVDAHRRADEIVVEVVLEPPRGRLPAHVLDLARAHLPALGIRFGRVVVVARLRGPGGVDVRVERPVRQIHAAHRIGQRAPLQRRRREPELAVPGADAVARARLAHGERQHALGAERRLGLRSRGRAGPIRRTRSSAPAASDRAPRSRCSSGT